MVEYERDHEALYEKFLRKDNISLENCLEDLAQWKSVEQLSVIINQTIGMDKKTLLHIAVEKNWIEKAESLVLYGARLDMQSENGDTPLHIASLKNFSNMIKMLIKVKHGPGTICYQENRENCLCRYKPLLMQNNKMRFPKEVTFDRKDKILLHETEILYLAGRPKNMEKMLIFRLICNAKEKFDVSERFYDRLLAVCIETNFISLISSIVWKLLKDLHSKGIQRIKEFVINAFDAHQRDARMSKQPFYFLLMCYEMLTNNKEFVRMRGRYFDFMSLDELNVTYDDSEEFRDFFTWQIKSLLLSVTSLCEDNTKKEMLIQLHNNDKNQTDWSGIGLKQIHDDWLQDIKLTNWLKLERNSLATVPNIYSSNRNFIALTKLEIQYNSIKTVPAGVFTLKLLRVLDLSHNLISKLPTDIEFTDVLHELYLSHNKLTTLPNSMKNSHISHLDLGYNQFVNLPLCVCYMPMLVTLVLDGNKGIIYFPHEMGKMKTDIELRVKDMELHYPPSLLETPNAGEANRIVLHHRHKLYPTKRNKRMNLMVVGRRGSGKSLLIQRLLGNYNNVYEPDPTMGVNVDFELHFKTLLLKKSHMKVMDFAGDVEYSTNQCFFTDRSLYLLVWDVRNEMYELEEWLNCLATFVPDANLMIAGTHAEKLIEKEDRTKLRRKLAEWLESIPRFRSFTFGRPSTDSNIGKYWFTMVSNDVTACSKINAVRNLRKGIKQVSKYVKNPSASQKVIGERLPKFYFSLAEEVKLKSTVDKFMMNEEMLYLMKEVYERAKSSIFPCRRKNEENTPSADLRDLADVLQYMHDTGVLLHFKSNANLQEMCFIDVKTLRNVLLQLSRPGLGAKEDGKLTILELQELIGRDYAQSGLEHLLRMFHIGFNVSPGVIQLTHSMDEKRPQINQPISFCDPVEYHRLHVFDYVPFGFWVKLISRIISYLDRYLLGAEDLAYYERPVHTDFQRIVSDHVYYWKYGFIYNDESNQIYVEISQLDKDEDAMWSSRFSTCPEIEGKTVIHSTVSSTGRDVAPRLIASIVDDIRTLIEEWHNQLANVNAENRSGILQYSPCCSCISGERRQPHLFELDESLKGFLDGTCCEVLKCPAHAYNNLIPIKSLFPEFVFYGRPRLTLKSCHTLKYEKNHDAPSGGFGKVYKGKLISHEKCGCQQTVYDVAVKNLKFTVGDLGFVGKFYEFRKEVLMLNRVSVHPNIISLYGVHVGKELEIVMEYAPYGGLDLKLLNGPLPRLLLYRISYQIADALSFFHSWGILHRDLKPSNIVLFSDDPTAEFNIKIIDFGTANYMSTSGMGKKTGSQRYYAPEVSLEKSGYTQAVDIWCYSLVLYEMLTGLIPFKGVDEKDIQNRLKVFERPQFEGNTHKCLRALTEKSWENIPSKRPSAKQILSLLRCTSFQLLANVFQLPQMIKEDGLTVHPNFVSDKLSFVNDFSLMCVDVNDMSKKMVIDVRTVFRNVDLVLDYLYVEEDHVAFVGGLVDGGFEVLFIKLSDDENNEDEGENMIGVENDMLKINTWSSYTGKFQRMFCYQRSFFLYYLLNPHKKDTMGVLVEYYCGDDGYKMCSEKDLPDCLDISMNGNVIIILYPTELKFYKALQPGLSEPKIVPMNDVRNILHDRNLVVINRQHQHHSSEATIITYKEEPRSLKLSQKPLTFSVSRSYQHEVATALARVPSSKMFWLGTDHGRIHICKLLPDSVRILNTIYPYQSPVRCLVLREGKCGRMLCASHGRKLNKGAHPSSLLEFNREFLLEEKVPELHEVAADLLLLWHVPSETELQFYPSDKKEPTPSKKMKSKYLLDDLKTETKIIKDLTYDCSNRLVHCIN